MDELHASSVPLVDKDNGSNAIILPTKTTSTSSSSTSTSTAVLYKSCNNSTTIEETTTTGVTTKEDGSGIVNAKSEPVPLLNQLQALPLQKTNDLKQSNANYG